MKQQPGTINEDPNTKDEVTYDQQRLNCCFYIMKSHDYYHTQQRSLVNQITNFLPFAALDSQDGINGQSDIVPLLVRYDALILNIIRITSNK